MKKIFTLFISTAMAACLSAQTVNNGGFETWTTNNEGPMTFPTPQGWITSDILASYFFAAFGDSTYQSTTVTQTSTAHSGTSAVQMTNALSNHGDTVEGGIVYCESVYDYLVGAFGGIMVGHPFTFRPANFTGYYQLNQSSTDSASIGIMMTKWNTTTNMRDTLVLQTVYLTNAAGWTQFNIPLTYMHNEYPDSLLIVGGFTDQMGTAGSTCLFDDFGFTGNVPVGMNELVPTQVNATVYPNPFSETATLSFNGFTMENASIELYDVNGNNVQSAQNVSGSTYILRREGLANGLYFYSVVQEGSVVASGKINLQ